MKWVEELQYDFFLYGAKPWFIGCKNSRGTIKLFGLRGLVALILKSMTGLISNLIPINTNG